MNTTSLRKSLLMLRHFTSKNLTCCTSTSKFYCHTSPEANIKTSSDYTHTQLRNKKPQRRFKENLRLSDSQLSKVISSERNNPDNFGTLSDDWEFQQKLDAMPDEEDDVVEKEFLNNREGKTRLTTNQYGKIIKQFLSQKKISNALDVLETRMLKVDKVQPENYIYNLLIGACGQVGYTKKAFQLYNQMKERGLKVTGHTYTGLFNACANSPYPHDGLKRAQHLRALMIEKAVLFNPTIYHTMIKAFGRCGDLETAFMLVDEMLEKQVVVTDATFNFLLQACITDKTSGFRHALMVWRKMVEKRIRPNLYSFNLLLRCSRDCGLGDEAVTHQVIKVLLQSGQRNTSIRRISSPTDRKDETSSLVPTVQPDGMVPNLICQQPTMGSVVTVTNITLPEHRLMLMGGSQGILELMRLHGVKPDIKSFTQLLDQLPPALPAELELLGFMKQAGVSFDVDFCNMLIRKRCIRADYEEAKNVLKLIQEADLRPNILTFGVLAMACQTLPAAQQLLKDIDNVGFRPNVEILGTLLKNACFVRDCDFVMKVMRTLEQEHLKPNEPFLKHLDNFHRFASSVLSTQEADQSGKLNRDSFIEYCQYYRDWRKQMSPESPPHPWKQFRETYSEPEDVELINYGRVKYAK